MNAMILAASLMAAPCPPGGCAAPNGWKPVVVNNNNFPRPMPAPLTFRVRTSVVTFAGNRVRPVKAFFMRLMPPRF